MSHLVSLEKPIPAELVGDFLGKLYHVSEDLEGFRLDGDDRLRLHFETRPGREASAESIAARIHEVAKRMCTGHRHYVPKILAERHAQRFRFSADPLGQLKAQGDLFEYGPGRFGFGPLPVALMSFFERELLTLADRFKAVRHQFPSLIGADLLQRCRYIQSFPHALTLTCHLREDLEAIKHFAGTVQWKDGRLDCSPNDLAGIKCLLCPTVCFHYYGWLQDRQLPGPSCVTALGRCYRYEAGNMASLERLWDFSMREIIFVGPQAYVLEQRQHCIDTTVAMLDRWQLSYDIRTATDPFFIEGYASQVAFQSAFDLKFEIRADLPYKNGSLAVGSFNYHQDFFGRSLGITLPERETACTACVGYGMERLVWAFVAQHGPDPAGWPAPVRTAIAAEVHR